MQADLLRSPPIAFMAMQQNNMAATIKAERKTRQVKAADVVVKDKRRKNDKADGKKRKRGLTDGPVAPRPDPARRAGRVAEPGNFGCARCRQQPSGCLSCNPAKAKKKQ